MTENNQLTMHNAFMTYKFWHQVLFYAAPASIGKTGKLIQDSNVIPDRPNDFHCKVYAIAKSHHSAPKPSTFRVKERREYIHSEFCGPLPIPSLTNALYYISLIKQRGTPIFIS